MEGDESATQPAQFIPADLFRFILVA
jgi:hypothetical protein